MKIPADILKKADEVLKKRADQRERERKEAEQRVKDVRELKDLKKSCRVVSMKRVKLILAWVAKFMASAESKKIFKVTDEVNIFGANFWLGRPQPAEVITTWAKIVLNKEGRIRYEERYKGHTSSIVLLGPAPPHPAVLVRVLHPEFLKQWEEAIRNEKVWDYIRHSLPRVC